MKIEVIEDPVATLAGYGGIPIAFEVGEVFDVIAEGDGRFRLEARRLPAPYVKDYDAIGGGPMTWADRFDLSNWGFFSAVSEGRCVGRAAVASDPAQLWDIRVASAMRGRGVGSALFEAAADWAASRGCRQLEIETQNINVAACRFYAAQGCVLYSVRRDAYPDLPEEIQLVWMKRL
jgi:GNAT superfamily N-acetyltransferase